LAFGVVDIGYNAMIPVLLFRVRLFGFCRIPRYLGDAISMLSITYQDFTHMTHDYKKEIDVTLSVYYKPNSGPKIQQKRMIYQGSTGIC